MMRKFAFLIALSAVLLPALLTAPVDAAFNPFGKACDGVNSEVCNVSAENPVSGEGGVLLSAVQILSFVVGVAAVIMLIYGGFKYVTSNGDPNGISTAKNTILYAIVGVLLFLVSQSIVLFVINRL